MEAASVETIPEGDGWQYEPKWDGFRCLLFRDGAKIEIQSKAGQPLQRYFPELEEAARALKARRFVLDGEIVIPVGKSFSFDELLQRIHPAASRVKKLATEHPAWLIVFDLLVDENGNLLIDRPLRERRALLEKFYRRYSKSHPSFRLSLSTTEVKEARRWFKAVGHKVDGIMAKRLDAAYLSAERTGMQKIKSIRTADCVVGGFRYGSKSKLVGSLLLGLYDKQGLLHHVGFCSGLKADARPQLTRQLESLIATPGFTGRAPGGPSRWSTERSSEWQPLKPQLVVEVTFDHVSDERFRHGTGFVRWRPDKAPRQCTMEQLKQKRSATFDLLTP